MTFVVSEELQRRIRRAGNTSSVAAIGTPNPPLQTFATPSVPFVLRYADEVVLDGATIQYRLGETSEATENVTKDPLLKGTFFNTVTPNQSGAVVAPLSSDVNNSLVLDGPDSYIKVLPNARFNLPSKVFAVEGWFKTLKATGTIIMNKINSGPAFSAAANFKDNFDRTVLGSPWLGATSSWSLVGNRARANTNFPIMYIEGSSSGVIQMQRYSGTHNYYAKYTDDNNYYMMNMALGSSSAYITRKAQGISDLFLTINNIFPTPQLGSYVGFQVKDGTIYIKVDANTYGPFIDSTPLVGGMGWGVASTALGEIDNFAYTNLENTPGTLYRLYLDQGRIAGMRGDTIQEVTVMSSSTYNDDEWHYVVLTSDGDTLYLYLDNLPAVTAVDSTTYIGTSSDLYMGRLSP